MATRIYLAGPQVFLPDALDVGGRKQKLCDHYGFVGVFPLDVVIDIENLPPEKAALKISRGNEELIRSCDLAIADMTPYRGPSADVGTAYEMGFARGMGLPVLAYTNVPQLFVERTTAAFGGRVERGADGRLRDAEGMALEEWGMVDNLKRARRAVTATSTPSKNACDKRNASSAWGESAYPHETDVFAVVGVSSTRSGATIAEHTSRCASTIAGHGVSQEVVKRYTSPKFAPNSVSDSMRYSALFA